MTFFSRADTASTREPLLHACNNIIEIMGKNAHFCCPRRSPSCKLAATSPQVGGRFGLSQTRDAIAPEE
jgi:hypothetical protein